ncbi:hypothetical protein MUP05_05890 [Candidatus Bathyarchaeota archaeon]|nr:hypothetical protein [Candidatus Bathyarchaeota archaeon]
MAKIVHASEIGLERAIIRLETVWQLGIMLVQLMPVISVIEETKGKIEGVIPEVASELGIVHSMLHDTVKETEFIQLKDYDMASQDDEAKKIFEESSAYAEQRVREQFPPIPSSEQPIEKVPEPEGLDPISDPPDEPAREIQETVPEITEHSGQRLSSLVFEYIINNVRQGGKLNLARCAEELGVERGDVEKAVEMLRDERRIVLR